MIDLKWQYGWCDGDNYYTLQQYKELLVSDPDRAAICVYAIEIGYV